jgi:hypothetical protein
MRTAIVALVTTVALLTSVIAGPRKVIVLPLDGNAPAAQKSQLNDSIARVARAKSDGDVTIGDTTFAETAAAVGCDPATPACAETVRSTLAVDELVYGTAKTDGGRTTVTVYRATEGSEPTSRVSVLAETDSGDKVEPAIERVFTGEATGSDTVGSGSDVGSGSAAPVRPRPKGNFFDTRERKLGVGLAGGGVVAIAIGISFWASKSDLQDQIDAREENGQTRTLTELEALQDLEDRAGSKAMWGNIMVGVGLGLAAAGAYFLYKDHQNRSATVTPAPVEAGTGMTLVLGGRW